MHYTAPPPLKLNLKLYPPSLHSLRKYLSLAHNLIPHSAFSTLCLSPSLSASWDRLASSVPHTTLRYYYHHYHSHPDLFPFLLLFLLQSLFTLSHSQQKNRQASKSQSSFPHRIHASNSDPVFIYLLIETSNSPQQEQERYDMIKQERQQY